MAKMTGGKAVLESLKTHGVDTLFGIISVHNLDLYDALFDQQDSFRYIGGRMELGCGFMADGYSRVSGKPGVVITSTGPGAADSIGAMGEAYHFRLPHPPNNHQRGKGIHKLPPGRHPRTQGPA